ncbi:hypothetical protein AK830_g4070 [Neonectria ditissima]|uniref:Uncharacterized protein n=1 Tax=Neonectria ditissima TaxID=78410 RepID=A0A0P7AWY6_9HYPO|nr:hypothetical protein AK830_g4070 [Neonectria ditissima]
MRKFLRKFKDGGTGKESTDRPDPKLSGQGSKHVVNPSDRLSYYPPNPSPPNPAPPNPHRPYSLPPPPGPSDRDRAAPITSFSGFDSWMSSFAPDPQQHGVVEVAAGPVDEVAHLANKGFPAHESIAVAIQQVKKLAVESKRYTVVISGPWYMTLAQVNTALKGSDFTDSSRPKDFVPLLFARNAQSDPFCNGKHGLRSGSHVAAVDGPSSYDPDRGLLISRHETLGAFVHNLRRLNLSCSDGMLKAESFPASTEINFNRNLRLPEGTDIHHHPSGLGIIPVYNTAAI